MSGRIPTAQPVGERRNELVYTRIRRRERNFFVFSSVDIFIKRLIRKKTGQAGRASRRYYFSTVDNIAVTTYGNEFLFGLDFWPFAAARAGISIIYFNINNNNRKKGARALSSSSLCI